MRKGNPKPLPPALRDEVEALAARPQSGIDTRDMPEVADWSGAVRGALYRPIKKPVALRLDADVLAWFKQGGEGYQTRINAALREYMARHRREHG